VTTTFGSCTNLGDLPVDERLNFVLGQVLGVKDFQQEQVYFVNKNRVHNRSLHGYGTVWGLPLSFDGTGDQREVRVGPGLAVDPCGQEIEVHTLQCANLNGWLTSTFLDPADGQQKTRASTLQAPAADPNRRLLHVVLCYGECLTGLQPVFGEPCRDENQAVQPTRIKDDFHLDLVALPPEQVEEDRVRDIGGLLGRIRVEDVTLTAAELDTLQDQLRTAIEALPVQPAADFVLPRAEARELLRDMFKKWVVDHRDDLQPAKDPCLLLGDIELSLTASGTADEAQPITIDETRRPYLLHTRLLQEWLMARHAEKGDKGDKGDQGDPGVPGADGHDGAPGTPGADGHDGAPGTPGTNGHDGAPGTPGANGHDGPPGPGLDQAFFNPNMMMAAPTSGQAEPAILTVMPAGFPSWVFRQARQAVAFSTGRPHTYPVDGDMTLRIYWSLTNADMKPIEGRVTWGVTYRWVKGLPISGGPADQASELRELPAPAQFVVRITAGNDPLLAITDPISVTPKDQMARDSDYLLVAIGLVRVQPANGLAHLLLAELDWKSS